MTSPPLASPSRAASQAAPGPHGAGAGAPAGSQSPSPRYRPYTVTHPWGSSPSPAPRASSLCLLSGSPGLPTLASSPQAVPAGSSGPRSSSAGPPLLSASPGAVSRRPASFRSSPRYLCSRRAGCVCALQGKEVNTVWKNCRVTLTSVPCVFCCVSNLVWEACAPSPCSCQALITSGSMSCAFWGGGGCAHSMWKFWARDRTLTPSSDPSKVLNP